MKYRKGWHLGSRLWCLLWVCHFPIGILGQVWYLIVSIPDLCTLTYFTSISTLLSTIANEESWDESVQMWNLIEPSHRMDVDESSEFWHIDKLNIVDGSSLRYRWSYTINSYDFNSNSYDFNSNYWQFEEEKSSMRRSSFFQSGPTLTTFFYSWWGERGFKYHKKCIIIGPPARRHLNCQQNAI